MEKYLVTIGVFGVVFDDKQRVLLCHRKDYGLWNLPGGALEKEEAPWEGVKREVKEETGLDVEVSKITGIYFKPKENNLVLVFLCKVKSGEVRLNDEADAIEYFDLKKLPANIVRKHIERIEDAFNSKKKMVMKIQ